MDEEIKTLSERTYRLLRRHYTFTSIGFGSAFGILLGGILFVSGGISSLCRGLFIGSNEKVIPYIEARETTGLLERAKHALESQQPQQSDFRSSIDENEKSLERLISSLNERIKEMETTPEVQNYLKKNQTWDHSTGFLIYGGIAVSAISLISCISFIKKGDKAYEEHLEADRQLDISLRQK